MIKSWDDWFSLIRLAASEGLCPEHRTPLQPAPYHPCAVEYRAFGWCAACALYYRCGGPGAGVESGYGVEGPRHAYQRAMGYPIS